MIKDFTINIKDIYIVYLHASGMNYTQIQFFLKQEGIEITTQTISKSIKRVYTFFEIDQKFVVNRELNEVFTSQIPKIFRDIELISEKISEKTKLYNKISIICLPVLISYFIESWEKHAIATINKDNIKLEFSEGLINNCVSSILSEHVDFAILYSSEVYPMINVIDTEKKIESKIISHEIISPYFTMSNGINNNLPINEWDIKYKKHYSYRKGTFFYNMVKLLLGPELNQFTPLDEFDSSASMLNRLLSSNSYSAIAWLPDGLVGKQSYGSAKVWKNDYFRHKVYIKIYKLRGCKNKIVNDIWEAF